MGQSIGNRTYLLRLTSDDEGDARDIEFEASGPEVALRMAHQFCGWRPVELFEDGRKLANLRLSDGNGFWMIDRAPPA